MGEYYCPLCNSYHDSTNCCPRPDYTSQIIPSIPDPNFELNWRLDKIITLLELTLQEVRNK